MRVFCAALACCACIFPKEIAAQTERYILDKHHTVIACRWEHLGASFQTGRFRSYEGELILNRDALEQSQLSVQIDADSFDTGSTILNRRLKKAHFLHTKRFPIVSFESTSIRLTGEKTGKVKGILGIRARRLPVTLEVVWNYDGPHPLGTQEKFYKDVYILGFSARGKIRRSDWGIDRGLPFVPDELEILIETELLHEKSRQIYDE